MPRGRDNTPSWPDFREVGCLCIAGPGRLIYRLLPRACRYFVCSNDEACALVILSTYVSSLVRNLRQHLGGVGQSQELEASARRRKQLLRIRHRWRKVRLASGSPTFVSCVIIEGHQVPLTGRPAAVLMPAPAMTTILLAPETVSAMVCSSGEPGRTFVRPVNAGRLGMVVLREEQSKGG